MVEKINPDEVIPDASPERIDPSSVVPSTTPELRNADPTWTQWAKWKLMGGLEALGMQPRAVQHFGGGLVDLASAATPMGTIFSAADLTHDLPRGNYGAAALDALGTLPGLNTARKIIKGYPRVGEAVVPSVQERLRDADRAYGAVENAPLEYHPDAMAAVTRAGRYTMETPNLPAPGAGRFSPEKAPEAYATLARYDRGFPTGGTRPVYPIDLEGLRADLRGLPGPSGPAGGQAVAALDALTMYPPPGMLTRGTQADLATARANLETGRGNWRSARTEQELQDMLTQASTYGEPIAPKIRRGLESDTFAYASPEERAALTRAAVAAQPNWADRTRTAGVALGSAVLGGAGAHAFGLPGIVAAPLAMATGTGGGATLNRIMQRHFGDRRATQAAEEAGQLIAKNSPLYRARAAAATPSIDPASVTRDAIAMAMMPAFRQQGTDWWNSSPAADENR